MRSKKVTRYWCDFCNKAGLQAGAMIRHESRCTLNPNRKCGACNFTANGGHDHTALELATLLPKPVDYVSNGVGIPSKEYCEYILAVERSLPILREAAGNCPACMMAAIRLSGNPVPAFTGFNFKNEMQSLFDDRNAENRWFVGH